MMVTFIVQEAVEWHNDTNREFYGAMWNEISIYDGVMEVWGNY